MKGNTHWVWGDQESGFEVSDARLNPRWGLRCLGHSGIRATNIEMKEMRQGRRAEKVLDVLAAEGSGSVAAIAAVG
jgi:hypothetical protein